MTHSPSLTALAAGILTLVVAIAAAGAAIVADTHDATPTATLPPMSVMLAEKTLGSPTAPVTMIDVFVARLLALRRLHTRARSRRSSRPTSIRGGCGS